MSPARSPVARAIRVPMRAGMSSSAAAASDAAGMSSSRCEGSMPLMTTDRIRPPGYIVPGTRRTAVARRASICRWTA